MSRKSLYWLLQIFGWGFVWIMNSSFASLGAGRLAGFKELLTFGLCSLSGVALTDLWRRHMARNRYLEMPPGQNIRRYLTGVLALGCVLTFLAGVWFQLLLVPNTFRRVDWIPSALLIWTILIAAWTGIYLSAASLRRAEEFEKQRLQSDLLARDARLQSLRMQLNPHFLFNSLNSLRALIFEDAHKASEMVDRLAALLRYSLQQSDGNELVTLADELQMVNEYLCIERIRFEERLQVQTQIQEGCQKARLPKMLLQTLIENAVKHGVGRSVSGGCVSLRAEMKNGSLLITVLNPGTLASESNSTRIGLRNAEQRLSLLVGRGASLGIRQAGSQVEATVLVPQ